MNSFGLIDFVTNSVSGKRREFVTYYALMCAYPTGSGGLGVALLQALRTVRTSRYSMTWAMQIAEEVHRLHTRSFVLDPGYREFYLCLLMPRWRAELARKWTRLSVGINWIYTVVLPSDQRGDISIEVEADDPDAKGKRTFRNVADFEKWLGGGGRIQTEES